MPSTGSPDGTISDNQGSKDSVKTPITISNKECFKHYRDFIKFEKLGLSRFYDDAGLAEKSTIGKAMIETLLAEGCNKEVAKDISVLTLYDLVMLIDDSSSMRVEGGGSRIETLKQTLKEVTKVYDLANPEGILSVRFLNAPKSIRNVNKTKAEKILDGHIFRGVTRIGTELEKVLQRFVWNPEPTIKKPLLVMIITDGAAEGERHGFLQEVIIDCVKRLKETKGYESDAVAFHFARVGDDEGAAAFLRGLDCHPIVGDHVDCLPMDDLLENIADRKYKWTVLPKLLVGAIVKDWDKQGDDRTGGAGGDDGSKSDED